MVYSYFSWTCPSRSFASGAKNHHFDLGAFSYGPSCSLYIWRISHSSPNWRWYLWTSCKVRTCFYWRPKTRLFLWNALTAWKHSRISTIPRGSERSEWASCELGKAKQSAAERVSRVSSKRTNIASDQATHSKRDYVWLETPPKNCL